jgi:hypothetical protein
MPQYFVQSYHRNLQESLFGLIILKLFINIFFVQNMKRLLLQLSSNQSLSDLSITSNYGTLNKHLWHEHNASYTTAKSSGSCHWYIGGTLIPGRSIILKKYTDVRFTVDYSWTMAISQSHHGRILSTNVSTSARTISIVVTKLLSLSLVINIPLRIENCHYFKLVTHQFKFLELWILACRQP